MFRWQRATPAEGKAVQKPKERGRKEAGEMHEEPRVHILTVPVTALTAM